MERPLSQLTAVSHEQQLLEEVLTKEEKSPASQASLVAQLRQAKDFHTGETSL